MRGGRPAGASWRFFMVVWYRYHIARYFQHASLFYCFCFKIMLACSDLYAMHIMYRYRYSACNTYFFFMSNG